MHTGAQPAPSTIVHVRVPVWFAPSGQINLNKRLNRKEHKEHKERKGFQSPVLTVGCA